MNLLSLAYQSSRLVWHTCDSKILRRKYFSDKKQQTRILTTVRASSKSRSTNFQASIFSLAMFFGFVPTGFSQTASNDPMCRQSLDPSANYDCMAPEYTQWGCDKQNFNAGHIRFDAGIGAYPDFNCIDKIIDLKKTEVNNPAYDFEGYTYPTENAFKVYTPISDPSQYIQGSGRGITIINGVVYGIEQSTGRWFHYYKRFLSCTKAGRTPSGKLAVTGGADYPSGAAAYSGYYCRYRLQPYSAGELRGPQCPAASKWPITFANGNKYLSEIDVSASILGGLAISRHYNSTGSTGQVAVGSYWQLNVDRHIGIDSPDMITAYRGDGKYINMVKRGSLFLPSGGGNERIERITGNEETGGWIFTNSDGEIEKYDNNGQLVEIMKNSGRTWMVIRNTAGRINDIINQEGVSVRFEYDENALVSSIILPNDSSINYAYNEDGDLWQVQYPDGATRVYIYNEPSLTAGRDSPHLLTGIIDESGTRQISYWYDTSRRAVGEELAG